MQVNRAWWVILWWVLSLLLPTWRLSASGVASNSSDPTPPRRDPPTLDEELAKKLRKSVVAFEYSMECGRTPTTTVKIDGFRVFDFNQMMKDLLLESKTLVDSTTVQIQYKSITGDVAFTLILGANGDDCAVPVKNTRMAGSGGKDARFSGNDDVKVIALGGKGGHGCAGWTTPTEPNDDNLNGGAGGSGGLGVVTWGMRGCVLSMGGRGGDGGSFSRRKGVEGVKGPGKAGSGGFGGPASAIWQECSVVGARGGNGGFPNNSSRLNLEGLPPKTHNADPDSAIVDLLTQEGGQGAGVVLTAPNTPNLDLKDFSPGARGGNGAQGAAAHVKEPFVGPGGAGGSVFRTGAGAQNISWQGGSGAPGTRNGSDGTVFDAP